MELTTLPVYTLTGAEEPVELTQPAENQQIANQDTKGASKCIVKKAKKAVGSFEFTNKKVLKHLTQCLENNERLLQLEQERVKILENILRDHNIDFPIREYIELGKKDTKLGAAMDVFIGVIESTDTAAIRKVIEHVANYISLHKTRIRYSDLSLWTTVSEVGIETVWTTFKSLFCPARKQRFDILKDLSGTFADGKLTLILGPPSSGKSAFMRLISGRLSPSGSLVQEGEITYNGELSTSGNFLLPKLIDYVDQRDIHEPVLTVEETIKFAFLTTTGGHHSYGAAKDKESAEMMDRDDANFSKVQSIINILGLRGCKDTIVGDGMLRGVSGGQKKRVTLGEFLATPSRVKVMDSISNGLDSATTFEIVNSLKTITGLLKSTAIVSLLQPPPEVFNLFDEVVIFSEGNIIYHGPREGILEYFSSLGYFCPATVDVADFLIDISTSVGERYLRTEDTSDNGFPVGSDALAAAWKQSIVRKENIARDTETEKAAWPVYLKEPYPSSFWFHFYLLLQRQFKLTSRNTDVLKARIMQNVIIGGICASLFLNLDKTDTPTMFSFLFQSALAPGLLNFSMIPIIMNQRDVFYKHSDASFYPSLAFSLAQSWIMIPVQLIEGLLFVLITYWSVGLTSSDDGERFFTFLLMSFLISITIAQLYRLLACLCPSADVAQPVCGLVTVMMVLFSGYIQVKEDIPDGWIWAYYANPMSWTLTSFSVNEFKSSDYDFSICTNPPLCTKASRFGDVTLDSRSMPTDSGWIWYAVPVLIGLYVTFLSLTAFLMGYLRVEMSPTPQVSIEAKEDDVASPTEDQDGAELPFESVSFAFKDLWYAVTLPSGEELDLLKGVSGYFEPGTITALMGSSGAGKTTLLDVLAGRKNSGTIKGTIMLNNEPKNESSFRRVMGYVEQFDALMQQDTAYEAIMFAAIMKLDSSVENIQRNAWIEQIISMLELEPIRNTIVHHMSIEQRKRLSIGIELAGNPALLFLDEPTTGLDSRAAQIVTRCMRRVAASGRTLVCTIHQPSTYIFGNFDCLLLLQRGGETIFFGELGENFSKLIEHFENAPLVDPFPGAKNPATWMLEVSASKNKSRIAGGNISQSTDFHAYYKSTALAAVNAAKIDALCDADDRDIPKEKSKFLRLVDHFGLGMEYTASSFTQFKALFKRTFLAYWRTPTYNFTRMMLSVIVALLFGSVYPNQKYSTDVQCISRSAVIFLTTLFSGILGLNTVVPVLMANREAYYREQQEGMYNPLYYEIVYAIVEVPYIAISSLLFTIPFFFIVGFDGNGPVDTASKFFWYWLFHALFVMVAVFAGQLIAMAVKDQAAGSVLGGFFASINSLFCGFMIKSQDFPSFWIFMYWLSPLHYAMEGIVMTQFHKDYTKIKTFNGFETTAENFINNYYESWDYSHRGFNVLALGIWCLVLRTATYFAMKYVRHQTR